FREPFATASGVVAARDLLLLRLEDDGVAGFGEAAPFEPYDGVPLERVAEALLNEDLDAGDAPPQARAAEEMARLDLAARSQGRALGDPGAEAIAVNHTLPAGPPEEIAAAAGRAARAGYSCFKLKVGLPDDAERVAAVRGAIGSWPALRVDANGAWTVGEAIERVPEIAAHDIELFEQPCQTLAELAEVRRALRVPIAADESVATPADVEAAVEAEACDAVNVKLATSGGFTAARETLRAATANGLEPYLSSTLDGPWGIAAALQLAASEDVSLACGLATLELFDAELVDALPRPSVGLQAVPQGAGLGVEVDEAALAEVLVEELE
ncbi:MAG TPA: enolase C-terminal domain-like protein, partial [Thermoleophilaceae bacterium]|nr:enolase C-terminal domain-like protein [Thermoleophilaceae bacterium]